ncbi:MAG: protein kinase [Candidatus Nealsonbacteria bacterium]|nr:protein kinase [Candidatus Nealsonbacteria bacterium]
MNIEQLGPYRIVRKLGRGGMGIVYEAVHVESGERAAVKLLSIALADEPGFRERFEAEVETLRKLNHPNVVRLFGFGEDDDLLFYAMELVDGSSLEQELTRGRRFDWREATRIGIDTCRALRHAHDRGVIHRDIKPGNLLIDGQGNTKLSDFGIARLFGKGRLTDAGNVLGTAEYMPPEQVEGLPVGPQADLYSLGAVLYVLLTRRPLFKGKSVSEVFHKQRFETPAPLGEQAPDVPVALAQIVTQLLDKDPQQRIPNATVLARLLEKMQQMLSANPADADLGGGRAESEAQANDLALPEVDRPVGALGRLPTTEVVKQPEALPATDALPAVDDLPPTKATAAFQNREAPQKPPESRGTFTHVAEADLDRIERPESRTPWISLHTWALVIALLAIGLTAWYLLQPPSADRLFGRIPTGATADDIDSLLQAEDDINEFLARFPADPRCEQLQEQMTEIKLYRLEKKFERWAKGLAGSESLLPIERAYLEAIHYTRIAPELGAVKLQALIELYDRPVSKLGPTWQCLRLARRRLERVRTQLAQQTGQYLEVVQDRLDWAEQPTTDPDRAAAIYRAVVELYQDKPWADEAVRRARAHLEANDE